ncbi:hypothetical protein NDN08_005147 [Rhodosorus marinus]|uniref:PROP1-like PPR domain-containing protein n=1 Tax=Rhodosorus marinus TaxID=101924 RepID=A0AAV8V426_9RHOD|nr:hypothetical protein NDN08_005147 [Rhodosorus marinus]
MGDLLKMVLLRTRTFQRVLAIRTLSGASAGRLREQRTLSKKSEMPRGQQAEPTGKAFAFDASQSGPNGTFGFGWEDFMSYQSNARKLDVEMKTSLMQEISRQGNFFKFRQFMEYTNKMGDSLDINVFRMFIRCLKTAKRYDQVAEAYKEMRQCLIEPTVAIFNEMINAFGKAKNMDSINWAVEEMEKEGLQMTAGTYSSLAKAYMKCGREDLALSTFARITADGLSPNADAYYTIMEIHAKRGKVGELDKVLELLKAAGFEVNRPVMQKLIISQLYKQEFTQAEKFLSEMEKFGGQNSPTAETYTLFIQQYARHKKLELAIQIYKRAVKRNCLNNQIQLYMLFAYARAGKPAEAEGAFYTLQRMKYKSSWEVYAKLVEANSRAGELESAERWFAEMQQRNLAPYDHAVDYLVRGYLAADKHGQALSTMRVGRELESRVSRGAYEKLVEKLGANGDIEGASATIEEMKAVGYKIPLRLRERIIATDVENARIEKAEKLVDEDEKGLSATLRARPYAAMAAHHLSSGRLEEARNWLKRMEKRNKSLNRNSSEILFKAIMKTGKKNRRGACLEVLRRILASDSDLRKYHTKYVAQILKDDVNGLEMAIDMISKSGETELAVSLQSQAFARLNSKTDDVGGLVEKSEGASESKKNRAMSTSKLNAQKDKPRRARSERTPTDGSKTAKTQNLGNRQQSNRHTQRAKLASELLGLLNASEDTEPSGDNLHHRSLSGKFASR